MVVGRVNRGVGPARRLRATASGWCGADRSSRPRPASLSTGGRRPCLHETPQDAHVLVPTRTVLGYRLVRHDHMQGRDHSDVLSVGTPGRVGALARGCTSSGFFQPRSTRGMPVRSRTRRLRRWPAERRNRRTSDSLDARVLHDDLREVSARRASPRSNYAQEMDPGVLMARSNSYTSFRCRESKWEGRRMGGAYHRLG